MQLVERQNPEIALSRQAELLELSRSSLYYQAAPISERELKIKARIDRIYTEHPYYGSRRMAWQLVQDGLSVNRKTVRHYMQEMGLEAIYPGPNLSKRNLEHKVYPYLLRKVEASRPNHIWGIDITYISLKKGWLYLVAILDWYSRYVVNWELAASLEEAFVVRCVSGALDKAKPQIFNSDQGSHFTSRQYTDLVEAVGVKISMDGRGRALDNIFTERLWRTVKYEEVYLKEYENETEARASIGEYLQYYNQQRPHQSLGYRQPVQVYFELKEN